MNFSHDSGDFIAGKEAKPLPPAKLFALFEPSITKYSIQYANGEDGKSRRFDFDKTFSHENLVIYYDKFQKVAEDIVKKLEQAGPDDHLPLGQYMFLFAVKAALVGLLGDSFHDDVEALAFKDSYDIAWEEMNRRLVDPYLPSDEDARSKSFLKVLTWTVYFLAANKHFQELLYQELVSVLGLDGDVSHHNISNLKYLRQILDEGLRCGVVAPWAARFEDVDRTLGGYFIPKGTPVIHALGVVLTDEKIWPEPHNPYGFAGKRICPGYRFAYVEATIMLATIIRNFEVTLVPGQTVLPKHGLVTHPKEEIWINVMKRK
ncbi:hypothetical protein C0Q70_09810 [Pomacea canaliculata]|uniref:Cytochrome P450 n=1 Tax=Pomacea canaliculata TaxID=400727 RepID=A0A2T7PAW2_POMCA|nr:hypothetical protein C0Q70_09810 [Pomacea canaliculata]